MKQVLNEKSSDPLLGLLENSPGWKTKVLASNILSQELVELAEQDWALFADNLVLKMTDALTKANKTQFTHAGTLAMLSTLSKLALDANLLSVWTKMLGSDVDHIIANNSFQHLIEGLLPNVTQEIRKHSHNQGKLLHAPK